MTRSGPRSTGTTPTTGSSWPRVRWPAFPCGARAGSRWSRAARSPTAPRRPRPTASSAPSLKYSGYDAIVIQGQAKRLSYLYINDDTVEIRDATPLKGKDTWETQQALEAEHGLSGHRMSVYSIGPAGENLVRFAAIQGDYGHVASKNGCGAVMGKKRLKAVCIVRGTKALRGSRSARAGAGRRRDRARSQDGPVDLHALQLGHAARRDEPLQAGRAADQELHDEPDRR